MDDRQHPPAHDNEPSRSAPSATGHGDHSPNVTSDRQGGDASIADRRSSTGKPALTERERRERWPLG